MFSRDIVQSDAFLDMPSSSQALYFHLGMEADDDGFVGNPKKIQKVIGTGDDDMKILLAKRFVLVFSSGVMVIKHHRINNKWDKYNCKRTSYTEEFSQLYIKENRAYTLDSSQGIPVQSDNSLRTVFRIEENRIDIPAKAGLPILEEKLGRDGEPLPSKKPSAPKEQQKQYDELCEWMHNLTGAPMPNRIKQYKHLSTAKENGISITRLKSRAEELWSQDFYRDKGMDWGGVVSSFNRKA